jgi:uncharacterized protein (TIGR00725 family)
MGPAAAERQVEDDAFELGRRIAAEGWILLTGGRNCGVMDAASRGAHAVPGSVTVGILPSGSGSSDVSAAVDIAIFTAMGDARNAINVQSSDVVVAFGAATAGTVSEVALALKAGKPVVLLGASASAREFLTRCEGVILVASDVDDAMAHLRRLVAAA